MSEEATALQITDAEPFILANIEAQLHSRENEEESAACQMISGGPGIGKTWMMKQLCKKHDFGLVAKYMGTMMVEQITGLPKGLTDKDSKYTEWTIPELFSFRNMEVTPSSPDRPMILFLDDIHLANKSIQSYQFQLLTYHGIHDHTLPDNVVILMAGNRSEDKAGFQQIMAPVSNRMCFLNVKAEPNDWIANYAVQAGIRHDIMSFIGNYPDMMESAPLESAPWASPRSWTNASRALDAYEKRNPLNTQSLTSIVNGHVGSAGGTKFVEYRQLFMQWEADKILDGTKKVTQKQLADFEKNRMGAYCLMSAMIAELTKRLRDNDFKLNPQIDKGIDIFRDLINHFSKHCREIVPLGLKLLILSEKHYSDDITIARKLITDDYVVEALDEIVTG